MSVKAICEALDTLESYADTEEDWAQHAAAVKAVENIRKVARAYMRPPKGRTSEEDVEALHLLLEAIAEETP